MFIPRTRTSGRDDPKQGNARVSTIMSAQKTVHSLAIRLLFRFFTFFKRLKASEGIIACRYGVKWRRALRPLLILLSLAYEKRNDRLQLCPYASSDDLRRAGRPCAFREVAQGTRDEHLAPWKVSFGC
jgi:hypothetical protein